MRRMTTCPPWQHLLKLLAGELSEAEQSALDAHLAACEACQQVLARLSDGVAVSRWRQWCRSEAGRPVDDAAITGSAAPGEVVAPPLVPGYEILGELGRGGVGVVYKARQKSLNRLVALKLLRVGNADPSELARFLREAEAVARLQHPHIVQIHEILQGGGAPVLCLEYVDGGSLAGRLAGTPRPAREAADLVETLARAVHYAHQRGIIHRDLKPSNILLGRESSEAQGLQPLGLDTTHHSPLTTHHPKITDFGLAKCLDADSAQTQSGAIVGTPSYMAPEQARGEGKRVGLAADVYALGAILYECLTGRPPFRAETQFDTLLQVVHQEPVPPAAFQKVPRDLETICLKCLHKEPPRRYASALDLADDLRRFLDGRPISARPMGSLERLWTWARRNPALAAACFLGLLAVGLALGGGGAFWQWQNAEAARQEADSQRTRAEEARDQADAARRGEEAAKEKEAAANEKLAQVLYLQAVQFAQRAWQGGHVKQALDVLHGDRCPPRRRGWEWHYVRRLAQPLHTLGGWQFRVDCLAFSPDGRRLVAGNSPNGLRVWDPATGAELFSLEGTIPDLSRGLTDGAPRAVVFTPEGKDLLSASRWEPLARWDAATGKRLPPLPAAKNGPPVCCLAISPDGKYLASGSSGSNVLVKEVSVWDAVTGDLVRSLPGHGLPVNAVAFSPDGKWLASGAVDGTLRVWGTDTWEGRELARKAGPGVSFHPDSRRLAAGGHDGTVKVWELTSSTEDRQAGGKEVLSCRAQGEAVTAVAFRPDGKHLAAGTDRGAVVVWKADTGQQAFTFRGHLDEPRPGVTALAYSPDGRWLASAGGDGTVQLWDASTGPEARLYDLAAPAALVLHDPPVWFDAAGRLLLVGGNGAGQPLDVYDLDSRQVLYRLPGQDDTVAAAAFGPAGRLVATAGMKGAVKVWDAGTRQVRHTLPGATVWPQTVVFSPDGRLLASTAGRQGVGRNAIKIWEVGSGREVWTLRGLPAPAGGLAFNADGTSLAATAGGLLLVWNTATGQEILRRPTTEGGQRERPPGVRTGEQVAFSPDGKLLATGDGSGHLVLWDADRGEKKYSWTTPPSQVSGLAFTPDGQRLAAGSRGGSRGGRVTLRDLLSGEEVLSFEVPQMSKITFGRGGNCLVAAADLGRGMVTVKEFDATPVPIPSR
jgi:WD40 repeat protein/tRNA A-37 threonylcarbamoyl transferase component Bud32